MRTEALHRSAWLFTAGAAALCAWVLFRNQPRLLQPSWPGAMGAAFIAVVSALGALLPLRARIAIGPLMATARITFALLLVGTWLGEAREMMGALAVAVAWRDAADGSVGERPLVPLAVALSIALTANASFPGASAGRTSLVALVAAVVIGRAWTPSTNTADEAPALSASTTHERA